MRESLSGTLRPAHFKGDKTRLLTVRPVNGVKFLESQMRSRASKEYLGPLPDGALLKLSLGDGVPFENDCVFVNLVQGGEVKIRGIYSLRFDIIPQEEKELKDYL